MSDPIRQAFASAAGDICAVFAAAHTTEAHDVTPPLLVERERFAKMDNAALKPDNYRALHI